MERADRKSSLWVINMLTGLSDGLILPFLACTVFWSFFAFSLPASVVAGMTVATLGALVFGIARYSGELAEIDHHHPELSGEEAIRERGQWQAADMDPEIITHMDTAMTAEKELWLAEIREHGLGWERADRRRALYSGLQTGGGFLTGGIFMLAGFCVIAAIAAPAPVFPAFFLISLCLFGALKGHYTGSGSLKAAARNFLLGTALLCAVGALGALFSG